MTFSLGDRSTQRIIGRSAWVMAWVALAVGQLHALARFGTDEGNSDLELPLTAAWAEPAMGALSPLLNWGDPDLVYSHYGKVWFPVFLAFTLAAIVVYRRRSPRGLERWAWRLALGGYVVACLGVLLSYWTQWGDDYNALLELGFGVAVVGLLGTLVGSTCLGVTLLLRRDFPVLPSLLLALTFPLAFLILQVTSMGNAALPVVFAFGILGRRLARDPGAGAQNETVGGASWPAGAS